SRNELRRWRRNCSAGRDLGLALPTYNRFDSVIVAQSAPQPTKQGSCSDETKKHSDRRRGCDIGDLLSGRNACAARDLKVFGEGEYAKSERIIQQLLEKEPRMYQLIRQQEPIVDRQFEIEFLDPGAEVFVAPVACNAEQAEVPSRHGIYSPGYVEADQVAVRVAEHRRRPETGEADTEWQLEANRRGGRLSIHVRTLFKAVRGSYPCNILVDSG
ncbi:MAG: hypothetical protein ABI859_12750, partial [Pseudomonadota bacterium]